MNRLANGKARTHAYGRTPIRLTLRSISGAREQQPVAQLSAIAATLSPSPALDAKSAD